MLTQLETTLKEKLKTGKFAKKGDYAEFQQDLQTIQKEYSTHIDLGVQVSIFEFFRNASQADRLAGRQTCAIFNISTLRI